MAAFRIARPVPVWSGLSRALFKSMLLSRIASAVSGVHWCLLIWIILSVLLAGNGVCDFVKHARA